MPQPAFVSHAQNGEDVVLWRALQHVPSGTYVEVGANHPTDLSVSRAFYDRGWSGLTIDPVQAFADLHTRSRPRDTFVRAAVTVEPADEVVLHEFPGTGLSTLDDRIQDRHAGSGYTSHETTVPGRRLDEILASSGFTGRDVHFMTVDTEGWERQVLESVDLTAWRPWVLVVESTVPLGTEQTHDAWEQGVLDAGYVFCLFDGISRFYVAQEHADRLGPLLSYPACPLDDYVRHEDLLARRTIDELTRTHDTMLEELVRWRTEAVTCWAAAAGAASSEEATDLRRQVAALERELAAVHGTLSWRVTAPLRVARALTRGVR